LSFAGDFALSTTGDGLLIEHGPQISQQDCPAERRLIFDLALRLLQEFVDDIDHMLVEDLVVVERGPVGPGRVIEGGFMFVDVAVGEFVRLEHLTDVVPGIVRLGIEDGSGTTRYQLKEGQHMDDALLRI
jgi:hypothetical protein